MKFSDTIAKALGVTLEVTGSSVSDPALRVMVSDLCTYPEPQVFAALKRCMREVRGRLTLADIIGRLDDGRPGPEEAWSMVPKDEGSSVFWTNEMSVAFAVAYPLIRSGDTVQARMAFLERYRNVVQIARDAGNPVRWEFSPGTDKDARELVLLDAAEKGRISPARVRDLLPYHREDEGLNARLLGIEGNAQSLPARPEGLRRLGETLKSLDSGER